MVKRLLLIFAAVLLASLAKADTFSSNATGNWNAAGTWTCSGVAHCASPSFPSTGDSVTINAHTVTCPVAVTCQFGDGTNNAAPFGLDITNLGTVSVVGTLEAHGNVSLELGGTLTLAAGGTFNGDCNVANVCSIQPNAGGGSTGTINMNGTAWTAGNFVTVNNIGAGTYFFSDGAQCQPILNWSFATISNFGDASNNALDYQCAQNSGVPTLSHILFNNDYRTYISCSGGAAAGTINNVDWRNAKNIYAFTLSCGTYNAADYISNLTVYNPSGAAFVTAAIWWQGIQVGKSLYCGDASDDVGVILYNALLDTSVNVSTNGKKIRNSMFIIDSDPANPLVNFGGMGNNDFCGTLLMAHILNPHYYGQGTPSSTILGFDRVQYSVFDGDGFAPGDAGDHVLCGQNATSYFNNNIMLNASGTMWTELNTGCQIITYNNTSYQSFGASFGETNGNATGVNIFYNNLFINPWNAQPGAGQDGAHQQNAFVRQSNPAIDYNGFYQMPGSGDSGAAATIGPTLYPHPTLGILSYLGGPINATALINGTATASTTTTVVNCSACNFTTAGIHVNDMLKMTDGSQLWALVSIVNSSTQVTLATAITGMASTKTFSIYPGYFTSTSQAWGTHDVHADPQFFDNTRTLCTWYKNTLSGTAVCDAATKVLVVTGTTGTTDITCAACTFTTWGITAGDFVKVCNAACGSERGVSTVASVISQTHLTLNTAITGLAINDDFTIITDSVNMARDGVKLNGWDYNAAAATAVANMNAIGGLNYIRAGFTPGNSAYKKTGAPRYGSPDIGATGVPYGQINSSNSPGKGHTIR